MKTIKIKITYGESGADKKMHVPTTTSIKNSTNIIKTPLGTLLQKIKRGLEWDFELYYFLTFVL